MHFRIGLLLFACGLVSTSAAQAATLQGVVGAVQVNTGSGYRPAAAGSSVAPGTMVMAGPQSSAIILHDNGCQQKVEPGAVVTVATEAQCLQLAGASSTAATGAGATPYLIGGAVIAGGAALAIGLSGGSKDRPASGQ